LENTANDIRFSADEGIGIILVLEKGNETTCVDLTMTPNFEYSIIMKRFKDKFGNYQFM
jgi:hypothetical protein